MKRAHRQSNNPVFILLLWLMIIFIGPIVVAWSLFSTQSHTLETLNCGHLIQPPLAIQRLALRNELGQKIDFNYFGGGWLMLYVTPHQCMKACQQNLYNLQQIRLALGKDMNRVKRAVLTISDQQDPMLTSLLAQQYLGTIHVTVARDALATFLNPLSSKKTCLNEGYLYLVDPHGNVMIGYQLDQKPEGILRDMKRLLSVSQIG